uniref:Reverse transcriptase domain-containing protein n=1 Tax=Oreochromis niloticus TaxID=8128 RepID=A0A669ESL6_ORENI
MQQKKHNILDKFQSGFRKLHSTETALLKVTNDLLMAADRGDCSVLVLLDLSSAFDTVDHQILIHRLNLMVGISGSVLKWFTSFLEDRTLLVSVGNFRSDVAKFLCGVPQGSVLSPLLFSLYILPLGRIISGFKNISYHLYADDIQLYISFKPWELDKLSTLMDCLKEIKLWMTNNFLQLNTDKTECLILAPENIKPQISQHLGAFSSSIKATARNLGIIFDQSLSFDAHIKSVTRSCFFHLRNIAKLRTIVSTTELEMLVHTFISSRLDYCNALFSCVSKASLNRLQAVQNAAARLLTHSNKFSHVTPILKSLHWLPVGYRYKFKILTFTFMSLQGEAPTYISELLQPYSPKRTLRSTDSGLLSIPRTRLKTKGDHAFQTLAPIMWNGLPSPLRTIDTVASFKKQLKTHLFRQAFG